MMNNNNFTPPNLRELSDKARLRYQELEAELLPQNEGKFVAILPENGDYEVGETREEAVANIRAKHGDKIVFVRRIGAIEKYQQHLSPLFGGGMGTYARIF